MGRTGGSIRAATIKKIAPTTNGVRPTGMLGSTGERPAAEGCMYIKNGWLMKIDKEIDR